MALAEGGSHESEAAVERALDWFVRHQFADGGWSFQHSEAPDCENRCDDDGSDGGRIGATGMALMCFLGAGYTQRYGLDPYRSAVEKGLYFLLSQMQVSSGHGNLRGLEGSSMHGMYCHGLATIAICEAYGMTADESLRSPAQSAVDFIVYRQSPRDGGWRYQIVTGGDMSVTGFQLMALRSAQLADLQVPTETIDAARGFLDRVESGGGSRYGYTHAGRGSSFDKSSGAMGLPTTTAVGLLCRMYTDRSRYDPGIHRGIHYLDDLGPSKKDMYYNYYTTMVMRQFGDRPWKQWNARMRDPIVDLQARDGHEAGSWKPFGAWGRYGGRLMDTAFCCMTLEVYYRYMPLYDTAAVHHAFGDR